MVSESHLAQSPNAVGQFGVERDGTNRLPEQRCSKNPEFDLKWCARTVKAIETRMAQWHGLTCSPKSQFLAINAALTSVRDCSNTYSMLVSGLEPHEPQSH